MLKKTFPATKDVYSEASAWLEEELEKEGASMKAATQVSICFEEMFVNVASYAYDMEDGEVEVALDNDNGMLSITLIDAGKPFDPLKQDDPDITATAEERDIGGLGILMVKKSMDEVSYKREDDKNIFTMKKYIL